MAWMAEIKYLPTNSPAQGTRFGVGCRSRKGNIASRPGSAAGARVSQPLLLAAIRSPTTPPNWKRNCGSASNTSPGDWANAATGTKTAAAMVRLMM